jgi:hypothetical protein
VFNSALRNVYAGYSLDDARRDPKMWGHFFESAIGAHLVSEAFVGNYEVYYWRDGDLDVDFILKNSAGALKVYFTVKINSFAVL